MEQLIIIVPSILQKIDMKKAKQTIKDYVGGRLIDTDENNIPGFVLKECLSKEDKAYLQEKIFPRDEEGCIVFIAIDDDNKSLSYLNAIIIDED